VFAFGGFLRHFRSGVPGAPTPAGVPVDRRAELEMELTPVLSRLDGAQSEANAIVAAARAEADVRRARANALAVQLVAKARAAAAVEQQRTTEARLAGADAERDALLDAAQAEAERINRAAQDRVPSLVTELAARLLKPPQ
jgi:vacuolar-type H+-ATPase subunit H